MGKLEEEGKIYKLTLLVWNEDSSKDWIML